MMSASPDPSPQSRPFGSLNQSNTQQSNASGGSLFERISKPEPEAPSSTQSDTSKETIAPGQGGSLFSRITKPDANITAPPSSEVDTQASGSTIATKPANHVFGGFKKPQAPQGSSPAFESANGQGVSQKSTTPSIAQETSNTTQTSLGSQRAYGMCPLAPAEFTENEKRELTTGWRLKSLEVGLQGCLRKKPGDVEKARIRKFYEYSRQAILAAKGGPLTTPSPSGKRKVPDAEDKTCDKRARVDTPRKPLEGPDPGAKRKVTDGGDDAETPQGKKTRVESPHHGQNGRLQSPEKASSSSQTSAMFKGIITTNESEVGGIQVPKFGPPTNFMAQFGQAAEKSAEAAKKKRKAVDYDSDEDEAEWERKDEEEQRVKKQKIEEAARSKFAKFVNGKMVWAETNIFGQLPSEESRSDDEGNEDDGHDDDGPPSGGLFDRITRDESGNVVRDEPPPRQMPPPKARDETIDPNRDLPPVEPSEPFISSSSITPSNFRPPPPFIPPTTPKTNDGNTGDHTWKPESPITFGATSSAPAFNVTSPSPSKPALGGLFGAPKTNATAETSTKPTSGLFTTTPAESPSASLGFGFTPANAASKPQAPSFNTEFVATTGKSANESKTTAETSIKPASNLFSATPAKSPGISSGVGFTPANAASKSLVPPPSTGFTNTAGKSADTIAETPNKPASSLFSMTPARPSSVNVGFTPANVVSKSLPRPSNTESSEASRTTSSNATPGDSTTTTAETPIKPASNLFSTTRAKSSSINLGFTPANAASKSLAPPSNTESATTSRATSPSATTGESANEFNADDEDHMPKDNQIDLAIGGPGEENEDTVFQVKAKAMLYDTEKKTWPIKGFGSFRVLKDRESGKTRMLMRQDPSGKILLNSALGKQLKYESSAKRMVMVPVVNAEGRLETWVIRTGLDDAAKKLASLLQEHKSA